MIVLINGKKRSGKDYVAKNLKWQLGQLGFSSEIISFADPIKDIISTTFNIPKDYLDELKNVEEPIGRCREKMGGVDYEQFTNMRLILQNFGTEAMKKWFGENVWVNLLLKSAREAGTDYVLVPDFRFLSEHIDGAVTVKVKNSDVENNSGDQHRSENELNDFEFDFTIDNTGYPDVTESVSELIKLKLGLYSNG